MMPRALPHEIRERVISGIQTGLSYRTAAEQAGVSSSSALRWYRSQSEQGHVTPKQQGGDRRSILTGLAAALIWESIERKPHAKLRDLQAILAQQGIRVSIATLSRFLARHTSGRKSQRK